MKSEDHIDYGDNEYKSRSILGPAEPPQMLAWLVRIGLAKNSRMAVKVLVVIITLSILTSIFLLWNQFGNSGGGEAIINEDLPENIRKALPSR